MVADLVGCFDGFVFVVFLVCLGFDGYVCFAVLFRLIVFGLIVLGLCIVVYLGMCLNSGWLTLQ